MQEYTRVYTASLGHPSKAHVLLLTDCSNAYQARRQIQFKGDCRMTKIHLSFLRDLVGLINLPYATSGFNISDTGTKLPSNVRLFYKLASDNRSIIAFLSRQEYRDLHNGLMGASTMVTPSVSSIIDPSSLGKKNK